MEQNRNISYIKLHPRILDYLHTHLNSGQVHKLHFTSRKSEKHKREIYCRSLSLLVRIIPYTKYDIKGGYLTDYDSLTHQHIVYFTDKEILDNAMGVVEKLKTYIETHFSGVVVKETKEVGVEVEEG